MKGAGTVSVFKDRTTKTGLFDGAFKHRLFKGRLNTSLCRSDENILFSYAFEKAVHGGT